MAIKEGVLFGLGNPLLDIQTNVDEDFLKKWNLKADDSILCDDDRIPMFKELLEKYKVEYIAGGATQNTIRVAQWILGVPKAVTYAGSIGNDDYGKILEEQARSVGVNTIYQRHDSQKTGTCACCINGLNRSLCAHLAAANCFTADHLEKPENLALVEKAQCYYIAGFHLTVCPPAIMRIAKHAADTNKLFCMNLSAAFLISVFREPMMAAMPYVDILFGNETEAGAFAVEHKLETTDMKEIALALHKLPKTNQKRKRLVVITQGCDPTVVVKDGEVLEFPVPQLKKEQILDTNGAGDSFVGGFLSQYIQGKPLEECVRCGAWAANLIIQRSGCTFPEKCEYK